MKQASKSLTPSGISRRKSNNFKSLRLYLIFGSLVIFIAFAVYTQILIQNAKKEQEYVPRIFARYIAYTDRYLRQSEQFAQMLAEITTKNFESIQQPDFQTAISDYMLFEFPQKNPIPVIITDTTNVPQFWNMVEVPNSVAWDDLPPVSKQRLADLLSTMNRTELMEGDKPILYIYIAKPVSLEDFIRGVNFSVVVADKRKVPLYWHNLEIPEDRNWASMMPLHRELLSRKLAAMTEVPLGSEGDNLGYIYFDAPKSLSRIRALVLLELSLALLLIIFSAYGLFLLHRTEKDTLWIGLAKETAHQFGTPITSLMGWIDLLREKPPETTTQQELTRIIDYMTTDLNQLKVIASRFGKVGSQTKLTPTILHDILQDTVVYFKDRLPHLGSRMDIHLISKIQGLTVQLDAELFKWTLENLIKNCIDAMSKKGGNIVITATHGTKHVYLHIRDEGKGIPHSQWKKVFDPGVTTKTRGWGLGLSLAKRIIEEYHHGQIKVLESTVGEGTTFEIKLPFQTQPRRNDA